MKVKMNYEAEIDPLPYPVSVGGKLNGQEISIPVSHLDEVTIERLCDEHRDNVFRAAGKQRPSQKDQGVIEVPAATSEMIVAGRDVLVKANVDAGFTAGARAQLACVVYAAMREAYYK